MRYGLGGSATSQKVLQQSAASIFTPLVHRVIALLNCYCSVNFNSSHSLRPQVTDLVVAFSCHVKRAASAVKLTGPRRFVVLLSPSTQILG